MKYVSIVTLSLVTMSALRDRVAQFPEHTVELAKLAASRMLNATETLAAEGERELIAGSYATALLGADNVASVDLSGLLDLAQFLGIRGEDADEIRNLGRKVLEHVLETGLTFGTSRWVCECTTPSGLKQGHALFVPEEKHGKLLENLGFSEEFFAGRTLAERNKLLANTFSGQQPWTELGLPAWGMRNVLVIPAYEYHFVANNIRHLTVEGEFESFEEVGTLTTRTTDANGLVIREHLPEGCRTHWVDQSRGEGLKGTLTDAPVMRWCSELGIEYLRDWWGNVHAVADLDKEGYHVIVPEDMLKTKLWQSDWDRFCTGYSCFWSCGHSWAEDEPKTMVQTSRQHLTTLFGSTEQEVADIASRTIRHLKDVVENGSAMSQLLNKLVPGMGKSALAHAFDDAAFRHTRNDACYARLDVRGTWGYCIWDLRPVLASAACTADGTLLGDEFVERARTLRGQVVAFTRFAKEHKCVLGRYPSLTRAFLPVYIAAGNDLCPNAIVMSWDVAANDVLKADTDGDHLVAYLPDNRD